MCVTEGGLLILHLLGSGSFLVERSLWGTEVDGSHLVALLVSQCLLWMLKWSCCLEPVPAVWHVFAFAIKSGMSQRSR